MTNPSNADRATGVAGTLRERNRARVQRDLQTAAMRLFEAQGYAGTTITQIADAAGVSPRTFFRHFRSKEDLTVDAPVGYGAVLAAILTARPRDEDAWTALRSTLHARTAYWQERPELAGQVSDLLADTPGLRAGLHGKTREWHEELAAAVHGRLDGPPDTRDLRADALVGSAIACLDAAFLAWRRNPGADLGTLFDRALDTVRGDRAPA